MSKNTNLFSSIRLHAWSAWGVRYPNYSSWQSWIQSNESQPDLTAKENEELPSVTFIPITHRKKLSVHTKLTLYLLNDLSNRANIHNTQIVAASRFGEMSTTIQLLEALGTSAPSSPMTFSRSVLNSAVGLHSILTQNTRTHVAISAIEDTYRAGLIEALMRSFLSNEKVIYVWADDVVPNCFDAFTSSLPSPTGLAVLLSCNESLEKIDFSQDLNSNPFQLLKFADAQTST